MNIFHKSVYCGIIFSVSVLITAPAWSALSSLDMSITNEEMQEQNSLSTPVQSADEVVENAINEYFDNRNITEGETRKGAKVYYSAQQVVAVPSDSPQWVKGRQIAFEMALLDARSRFVFDNFGRSINEAEQILEQDDSSDNRKFNEEEGNVSKIASLWDKAVALGEANLDKWLRELDVDPSQFDSVPPVERKNLFVQKYVSKTISKAMGESSGLLPVQTFEGSDENGATVIGVIMLYSPKIKQLANDIANQRAPILKGKRGQSISRYIDLPENVLAAQFGVRVVFKEGGDPVVLSYGQWGYSYQGSNQATVIRNRQNAGDTADVKATDGLLNFINSQLSLTDERSTGSAVENFMLKQGEDITEKSISSIIDKSIRSVKTRASANMSGTRVVKKWKLKESNGQEIIGRVRAWSEESMVASKDIQNYRSRSSTNDRTGSRANKEGDIRSGAAMMDPEEDF